MGSRSTVYLDFDVVTTVISGYSTTECEEPQDPVNFPIISRDMKHRPVPEMLPRPGQKSLVYVLGKSPRFILGGN